MTHARTLTPLATLLGLSLLTIGCPAESSTSKTEATLPSPAPSAEAEGELVVYCGRSEALVGPLLERFSQESAVKVSVRYGKTPALTSQFLTEGAESPADLIFAQDSGYLGALAGQGLLSPLPQELLDRVDPRFRGAKGHWLGTSGRARVLVYGTNSLQPSDLPAGLADLADPKWKGKLGWAPGNSSFQAHVSLLRHTWGEAKTKSWLEAMIKNEPKVYPKNSPQVAAAISGEIQIGWVNHYYLYRKGPDAPAANYSFRTPGDEGNVLMVSGLGIRAKSPRRAAAEKLLAYLVSEGAQAHFANEVFEYPTVPGIKVHERVPSLDSLNLATVDQSHLADVGPTLKLLQELGLQ